MIKKHLSAVNQAHQVRGDDDLVKTIEARLKKAFEASTKKDLLTAISGYQKLTTLNPDGSDRYYTNIGLCYKKIGEFPKCDFEL